jgi:hypothetical protein
MPSTYTLISSNVLGTTAASVTLSSIPSTFTDLVLRISARGNVASSIVQLNLTINGQTGTPYSYSYMLGNGGSPSASAGTNQPFVFSGFGNGSTGTANYFGSAEIYIPSYTASRNKPMSYFTIQENNTTTARIIAGAGYWRNTSAITSLTITPDSDSWIAGSSFYLYGIKNS